MQAHHVDKKDFFGKSDPYVDIFKVVKGAKVLAYKTEVIKNTLDPKWAVRFLFCFFSFFFFLYSFSELIFQFSLNKISNSP